MLTGEEIEFCEKAHESNIEKFMRLYGEGKEAEIRELYNNIKEKHEGDATVLKYIPIFVCREFEERYPLTS